MCTHQVISYGVLWKKERVLYFLCEWLWDIARVSTHKSRLGWELSSSGKSLHKHNITQPLNERHDIHLGQKLHPWNTVDPFTVTGRWRRMAPVSQFRMSVIINLALANICSVPPISNTSSFHVPSCQSCCAVLNGTEPQSFSDGHFLISFVFQYFCFTLICDLIQLCYVDLH